MKKTQQSPTEIQDLEHSYSVWIFWHLFEIKTDTHLKNTTQPHMSRHTQVPKRLHSTHRGFFSGIDEVCLQWICCPWPWFVVLGLLYLVAAVSTWAPTVGTSIWPPPASLSFSTLPIFNCLLSTELQLKYISPSDIWVLTLNKNTLADPFEGGLNQNFLKWPILVGQLPSCVNIPRFILWVLKCLQRSNCCKKMNTWNLTLLSFIDSGWKDELFQMLQYFDALGALQHLGCSLCHQYLRFVLFWPQKTLS